MKTKCIGEMVTFKAYFLCGLTFGFNVVKLRIRHRMFKFTRASIEHFELDLAVA